MGNYALVAAFPMIDTNADLGLEGVVLLAKVLLPEVMGVNSAPVPPLEHLVRWHVDILEVERLHVNRTKVT